MFFRGINAGFGEPMPNERLDRLKSIGCNLIRSDLGPPRYEQEILIEQLEKCGMVPLYIVRNQQHVDALPDGAWIELGNEPNLWDASLNRALTPAEYCEYYSPIRAAAIDRGMRVYVGSLSVINKGTLAYLDAILDQWLDVDDVSIHRYPYLLDQDPWKSPFGNREKEMVELRKVLNGRRFMVTEFGNRTVNNELEVRLAWPPWRRVTIDEWFRLSLLVDDVYFWSDQPDCDGAVLYQEWQGPEKTDLYGIYSPTWEPLPASRVWEYIGHGD